MQEVSSHICVFFLGKNLIKTLGILDKHTLVKYQYKKQIKILTNATFLFHLVLGKC